MFVSKKVFVVESSSVIPHPALILNIVGKFILLEKNENRPYNISYPSSAGSVVFGVHLSAQASFRFDRKSPAVRTCV
jgi:hypothetical protein